jgi:hypothetical protein
MELWPFFWLGLISSFTYEGLLSHPTLLQIFPYTITQDRRHWHLHCDVVGGSQNSPCGE